MDAGAGAPWGVGGEPRLDLTHAQPSAVDNGRILDLWLVDRQGLEKPVAEHSELQAVEDLVDLVAVPRLLLEIGWGHRNVEVANELIDPAVADDVGKVLVRDLDLPVTP